MATTATSEQVQELILTTLDSQGEISDSSTLKYNGSSVDSQVVVGAIKSLEIKEMIVAEAVVSERWDLSAEALEIATTGSHEVKVFNAIAPGPDGTPKTKIQADLGQSASIGQGKAFKNKWIALKGDNLVRIVDSVADETREQLLEVQKSGNHSDAKVLAELKKRKLVEKIKVTTYKLRKGPNFSTKIEKLPTDLTVEMLNDGSWKNQTFKKYNFDALGVPPECGHLHPLLKVREEYRKIFLEMGFEEMPTNNFVENSFWNFDALFQPQQHPARDAHDTFFLSDPATSLDVPADYLERVKKVHSEGGYGSIGYRYDWKVDEAQKNLLRTHTTAVSARMLYKLGEKFVPKKFFSIDRVFRNEELDATHLAEFHQMEGVVIDYGLTLGDLIGILSAFFEKLGIQKLRFKPAFNPYTEPSMEIFSYHEGLKKWVEIGNSGVFRPEMLLPMGIPEGVTAIAWGLSVERPTMIKYRIDNIRDLVGHKVDLAMCARNPMCRLDKHN